MLARLLIFSLLNFFGGYIFADHIQPSIEYEADLIRLVWTVAEDDPVQSFVIERSEENGYFTPIKELSALFYNNPKGLYGIDFCNRPDQANKIGYEFET
ncbi:MAG: hypothetical protein AAFP02_14600, partial [Bacteroidota bacterium]